MELYGRTDLTFSYIPSHLYYIMFEVLKNSLRAEAEHHGVNNVMPPVKVRVPAMERRVTATVVLCVAPHVPLRQALARGSRHHCDQPLVPLPPL